MARVYGFPGYRFATMPHPLASLDEGQIETTARDLLPQLLQVLSAES
jgi:hypothetical protein